MKPVSRLIRITTVPISLKYLITGQMRYMREHGFEVVMMSAEGPEIDDVVLNEGCPHEVVPLTRQITPFADLKALWILYRKLRHHRPDIVHTHTPKAGLIGMMAAWLARVPIRLHTVAGLPLETAVGAKRRLLMLIERLTYACATEVWPNSKSLYDFIRDHSLAKKDKLHVIGKGSSNGIDVSEFDIDSLDPGVLQEVKASIHYDSELTYLLFVGRVVRDKGIEELVQAFVAVAEDRPALRLVLVGPFEAALDPLSAETIGLIESRDDIITTGFSPYVEYYMSLADLFVFPSHREGFPNVPMQAGLMGLPVIASRITGNVDIIDHGINGLLCEKGDHYALQVSLKRLLDDSALALYYSRHLYQKVKSTFDRTYVQGEILTQYKRLLKSNRT